MALRGGPHTRRRLRHGRQPRQRVKQRRAERQSPHVHPAVPLGARAGRDGQRLSQVQLRCHRCRDPGSGGHGKLRLHRRARARPGVDRDGVRHRHGPPGQREQRQLRARAAAQVRGPAASALLARAQLGPFPRVPLPHLEERSHRRERQGEAGRADHHASRGGLGRVPVEHRQEVPRAAWRRSSR